MILLDTNVVSEFIKHSPDARVLSWLDARATIDCYICAPVLAELRYGAAMLADGKRKNALAASLDRVESEEFARRILMFDQRAAHFYGELRAIRERAGKPISVMDGAIAAIAKAHAMTLATRNVKDFEGLDIPLVNPFSA